MPENGGTRVVSFRDLEGSLPKSISRSNFSDFDSKSDEMTYKTNENCNFTEGLKETPNKNKAKNRKLCKNGYHKLFSSHRNDTRTSRSDTLREANYITPIDRDKEIKRAISLVIIGALIFFLGLLLAGFYFYHVLVLFSISEAIEANKRGTHASETESSAHDLEENLLLAMDLKTEIAQCSEKLYNHYSIFGVILISDSKRLQVL